MMSNLNPNLDSRNVQLSSAAPPTVRVGYHKILESVKINSRATGFWSRSTAKNWGQRSTIDFDSKFA
jgi:hypothetical protein